MRKRRAASDGFNMSFLDVMACGLGAVILIFILVDFNATEAPTNEETALQTSLQATTSFIAALSETKQQLLSKLDALNNQTENAQLNQKTQSELQAQLLNAISQQMASNAKLQQQLDALQAKSTENANVALQGTEQANFITGMQVTGKHIVILLDKSASMMAEDLVSVLGALALTPAERQRKAKWQRTLRVARWLIAEAPIDATLSVVAFSDTANPITSSPIKVADKAALNQLVKALFSLSPDGGTNLQLGLKSTLIADPNVTDVYLITDGLPTLGDGLNVSCRGVFTSKKTISSECRQQLMLETIGRFNRKAHINVVLLPLEGDPYASSMYWNWTQVTGGRFLAPAAEWPQ